MQRSVAKQLQRLGKEMQGLGANKRLMETQKESWDSSSVVAEKLDAVVAAVKAANGKVVVFTGAGISTSAGIPDYRSPMDTKLKTGPGVWTVKDAKEETCKSNTACVAPQGFTRLAPIKEAGTDAAATTTTTTPSPTTTITTTTTTVENEDEEVDDGKEDDAKDAGKKEHVDNSGGDGDGAATPPLQHRLSGLADAAPTATHYALAALHRAGAISYVVSQNIDGLHLRSGLPSTALSQLHGDVFLERCRACGLEHRRDEPVQHVSLSQISKLNKGAAPSCKHCADGYSSFCHCTARACSDCGDSVGPLVDTIVNFGENLHRPVLDKAVAEAGKADLCIVLGSSARVQPASEIPELAGKCVIVNLCPTAADDLPAKSGLPERIGATTDYAMVTICKGLGVTIPEVSAEQQKSIVNEAAQSGRSSIPLPTSATGSAALAAAATVAAGVATKINSRVSTCTGRAASLGKMKANANPKVNPKAGGRKTAASPPQAKQKRGATARSVRSSPPVSHLQRSRRQPSTSSNRKSPAGGNKIKAVRVRPTSTAASSSSSKLSQSSRSTSSRFSDSRSGGRLGATTASTQEGSPTLAGWSRHAK